MNGSTTKGVYRTTGITFCFLECMKKEKEEKKTCKSKLQ